MPRSKALKALSRPQLLELLSDVLRDAKKRYSAAGRDADRRSWAGRIYGLARAARDTLRDEDLEKMEARVRALEELATKGGLVLR